MTLAIGILIAACALIVIYFALRILLSLIKVAIFLSVVGVIVMVILELTR